MGRKLILKRSRSFLSSTLLMKRRVYSVLSAISSSYPHLKGRLPTCSSPVRHSRREASSSLAVRLACLRRAASVRSEPGSNSPLFYFKHPEGCLISIILSQSRFFYFRNVDLNREKEITALEWLFITLNTLLLSFFVLRLFSLPKIFALWLFLLSLPFNFKDRFARLRFALASQQAKKNISQNCSFCQAPFSFLFYFLSFFAQSYKSYNLKNSKKTFSTGSLQKLSAYKNRYAFQAKTWEVYTTLHCTFSHY